jgi:hypothetical protein
MMQIFSRTLRIDHTSTRAQARLGTYKAPNPLPDR